MPAHFKLLSGDTRKVLDEPYQGCPGGIIADEPEEHSLVADIARAGFPNSRGSPISPGDACSFYLSQDIERK